MIALLLNEIQVHIMRYILMTTVNPLSTVRQDVEFKSDGIICRAWLNYPAVTNNKNVPIVIMAQVMVIRVSV